MSEYTHFNKKGHPILVDITGKPKTLRTATAEGWVILPDLVYTAVSSGSVKKGDPFSLSEIAGIMGAKKTASLIPLCHTIRIDTINIQCSLDAVKKALHIVCEVKATESTGVEMEALTGVSTAALCFYDLCKAHDKGMIIKDIRLIKKSGGTRGEWTAGGYER